MKKQRDIFIAFFRSGILGYGGGPSSIPLVYKEVVERFDWMNAEEFGDILALANTLPGPINTKMAGYIGYRVGGYVGMVNAILASILPTIVAMILLFASIDKIKQFNWVNGMIAAIIPVVGVMMGTLTWQFLKNTKKDFGTGKTIVLSVLILIVLQFFHIHPAIVIAVCLIAAFVQRDKEEQVVKKKERTGA
jgi:chromate transporter